VQVGDRVGVPQIRNQRNAEEAPAGRDEGKGLERGGGEDGCAESVEEGVSLVGLRFAVAIADLCCWWREDRFEGEGVEVEKGRVDGFDGSDGRIILFSLWNWCWCAVSGDDGTNRFQ
jgi:hypothetical protein